MRATLHEPIGFYRDCVNSCLSDIYIAVFGGAMPFLPHVLSVRADGFS